MSRNFQKVQYNSFVWYMNRDNREKFDTHFDTLFCTQSRWRAINLNGEFVNCNKLKMQETPYLQGKTRFHATRSG